VIYLWSPELYLEVRKSRREAFDTDFMDERQLSTIRYRGVVDRLVVVMPARYAGEGKRKLILDAFRDYDPAGWGEERVDETVFLTGRRRAVL
jgi:hypothetical protein